MKEISPKEQQKGETKKSQTDYLPRPLKDLELKI